MLVEKIPPAMATSTATSGYWATEAESLSMKSAGFTDRVRSWEAFVLERSNMPISR